jgi:hypothetical protein
MDKNSNYKSSTKKRPSPIDKLTPCLVNYMLSEVLGKVTGPYPKFSELTPEQLDKLAKVYAQIDSTPPGSRELELPYNLRIIRNSPSSRE